MGIVADTPSERQSASSHAGLPAWDQGCIAVRKSGTTLVASDEKVLRAFPGMAVGL
jgi:hypothetical protein